MREKVIEEYLRTEVKKAGGKAYKFISPGNAGVPDRIVVLPGGRIHFVELKAPGGKSTPLQKKCQSDLAALHCDVWVLDSKECVDEFMKRVARQ